MPISVYTFIMARASTTSDVFNAVAEPRRRAILDALRARGGEQAVTDLVASLPLDQPTVSKHLRVLREVGLVRVRQDGRRRLYRLDGEGLKTMHDWTRAFEAYWDETLAGVKAIAEAAPQSQSRQARPVRTSVNPKEKN